VLAAVAAAAAAAAAGTAALLAPAAACCGLTCCSCRCCQDALSECCHFLIALIFTCSQPADKCDALFAKVCSRSSTV
jgi:hypothetical protein